MNIPDLRLPRIKEYPSILKKQTKIFHQVPAQYPLESAEVAITVFYLSKIIFSNECLKSPCIMKILECNKKPMGEFLYYALI